MSDPRPNIVMVMVDDASARMFGYLSETSDHVVALGATLPNYLLSQPLCAPSRATILRGQYSHNTGIVANNFDNRSALWHFQNDDKHCEESTLATWFQAAGYKTALVGKYMNAYGEDNELAEKWYTPPGWSSFFAVGDGAGDAYGYDAWYDPDGDGAGTLVPHGFDPDFHYLTNVIRDRAVEFLTQPRDAGEPFLLIVTPKAPHHPAVPHEDYQNDYPTVIYPKGAQNPAFDEADVSDKADYVRFQPPLNFVERTQIDYYYRRKLQCMESVDDLVKELVETIGDDAMENTYFIFCSDNGFHHGEHRLGHGTDYGGKNTPYEEDIRVPLYIRGPGIQGQSTVTQLVGNVDIAQTFCEMAGVTPDPDVTLDGRSFLPLVKGQTVTWRNYYLLSRKKGEPYAGLRGNGLKFLEYDNPQTSPVIGEYYNLSTDPHEETSTYNGLNSGDLAALQARLTALRNCEGNSCRTAEV